MVSLSLLSLALVLCACATATDVKQCKGRSITDLSDNVQLTPCKKPPCKLKKGTDTHITMTFTPDNDIATLKNHVTAKVFGADLPFLGVDGNSVCDKLFTEAGEKVSCPLKAGTKYVYKDSFPVHSFYPSLDVRVHWALKDGKKDVICFEVPALIKD